VEVRGGEVIAGLGSFNNTCTMLICLGRRAGERHGQVTFPPKSNLKLKCNLNGCIEDRGTLRQAMGSSCPSFCRCRGFSSHPEPGSSWLMHTESLRPPASSEFSMPLIFGNREEKLNVASLRLLQKPVILRYDYPSANFTQRGPSLGSLAC
jgi:hypothetical protein